MFFAQPITKKRQKKMSELASIVLDNGTGFVKVLAHIHLFFIIQCGFSCDDVPEQIIPTIYSPADKKIGKEAMFSEDLEFPMARGMVQNWDRMELIWSKLFKLLKVDSKEYNVHFSDAVLNPKPNREKMAQLFFEKYQVQGVAFSNSGALTTFATGRTSGLAFESGHGLTAVSPIFEGYAIAQGTFRSELAGQDVNALLAERLKVTGYRTLQNVKEQCCYIGENEHTNAEAMAFSLPDGSSLTIDKERTLCPEVLFNPEMEGLENLPVHKLMYINLYY